MRFDTEHRIEGIDLVAFEKLFFDEPFNVALCRHVGLHRRLLSREDKNGELVREVEVGAEREVPQPIAKVLGTNRFVYTERVEYRWGSYEAHWRVTPALLANKIVSAGRFFLLPSSAGDGVVRRVHGDIEVKLFGIGKLIERFVAQEIERSYSDAAAFTRAYLEARGEL